MRRLTRAFAAFVLVLVPLAACGASSGTVLESLGSPGTGRTVSPEVLRSISQSTAAKHLAFDATGEISIDGETVALEMAGEMSATGLDGEITMIMSAPGLDMDVTVRVVGGMLFMRIDALDVDDELGGDPGFLTGVWYVLDDVQSAMGGVGEYDPDQFLEILEGITGDVETLGTKNVDGAPADGYRVALSIDELVGAAASLDGVDLGLSAEDLEATREEMAGSTMTIDVWVRDGTAVRMVIVMELVSTMRLEPIAMRLDMRMRELADPVVVEAPADAQPLPGGF